MKRIPVFSCTHKGAAALAIGILLLICTSFARANTVISADFSDGLYPGTAGSWLSAWNSATNNSTTTASIVSTNAMNGGGNHLYVSVQGTSSGRGNGAVYRLHDNTVEDFLNPPSYVYNFDLRPDSLPWSDTSITIFNGTTPGYSTFNAYPTWGITGSRTAGWVFLDGNQDGTVDNVSSGISVAVGTIYHFTINVDLLTLSWTCTISDGTNSITSGKMYYRYGGVSQEGNCLEFAAYDSTTVTDDFAAFSVDNITIQTIQSIPEPSTILFFSIGFLLIFAGVKKRFQRITI